MMAGFGSLKVASLRASFPCWLWLETAFSSLPQQSLQDSIFPPNQQDFSSWEITVFCKLVTDVTSLNVAVLCWLKTSYWSGQDSRQCRLSGGKIIMGHFRGPSFSLTALLSFSPLPPSFLFSLPQSFILLTYVCLSVISWLSAETLTLISLCHTQSLCFSV